MFVVDGQYQEAIHVDESLAAGPGGECALLASFAGLNQLMVHNLTLVVTEPAFVGDMSFIVANVTTDVNYVKSNPTSSHSSSGKKGPPIAVIVVPAIAGALALAGLGFLIARVTRKKTVQRHKAPSAAFRAEHPELVSYQRSAVSAGTTAVMSPSPSFFVRDDNDKDKQKSFLRSF
ncbi:hypothetical protein EXIGLDRAFT_731042 [Exidia glandulosa HHB12029]|uniref:Uncharacterized protein n=1 Tax=Exidia glandulosa HHB12029 TaxID=1314781 RepID=A0A165L4J4_EXIGL|nr:hypothetical protein EXIGLDRAFT_731042 [Exidia glandulosa HHB12029]